MSRCHICAQIAIVFSLEDYMWWDSVGKKHCSWWCAVCGEKYDWRAPNRLLVVQTSESASLAKVFFAHAVPQGLCENLINALNLVANQQNDGDSPIQNIATRLRNFIQVHNHCALEVGHLKEGTRSFEVRRPKCEEGGPEVSTREVPEESTLRTEEVGSKKSCINVDHIEQDRWRAPLVDADWHAFCQAIYKGNEGKDWEELYPSLQRSE